MYHIHKNRNLNIVENTSDEVFITDIKTGVKIKVSSTSNGLQITSHNALMTPASCQGLPAIAVWGKLPLAKWQRLV